MNDIELAALTAMVSSDQWCMNIDNLVREHQGNAPAYDGGVVWETRDKLEAELKRRGILDK